MKVKELIKILFIVILITCFITNVCASENTTETINQPLSLEKTTIDSINNTISLESDYEILSEDDGTFSELQNLINSKPAGSTIDLDKNYKYSMDDSTEGIIINKDLTINGNNNTLNGDNKSRILYLTNGASVTLNNIKFINGKYYEKQTYSYSIDYSGEGAAIYNENCNININNCIFDNNIATDGAAIYSKNRIDSDSDITIPTSYIKINGSEFFNNHAFYSGTVYGDFIEIFNSKFINNSADQSGAIQAVLLNVNNSYFYNNSAKDDLYVHYEYPNCGGAITVLLNGTISNSEFKSNKARYGGAIFSKLTKVYDSNIWMDVIADSCLKLNNNKFYNNSAYVAGGAVFAADKLIDNGSVFEGNKAHKEGGAIYSIESINLNESEFSDNIAMYGGAISAINIDNLNNIKLNNNKAFYGDNIAFNNSNSNLNADNRQVYKFISALDEGYYSDLSDDYKIFFNKIQYDEYDWGDWIILSYPMIYRNLMFSEPIYFVPSDMFFIANISDINNGLEFVKDYISVWDDDEDVPYVDEFINYAFFYMDKWEELKLNKTRELLNDSTISGKIPNHGFFKQINSTTYAFIDFEVLESELQSRQYIKGPGYFSFWIPAYKITYKNIHEISNLTVEKRVLNSTVHLNDTVSFNITLKNTGLINLTDVFVKEFIPDGLEYIDFVGENWSKNGEIFNYNNQLNVNESISFIILFKTVKSGNLTNNITAGSNQTYNKTDNDTVEVLYPSLNAIKISLNKTVTIGDDLIFEIIIENDGQYDLDDVFVIEDEYDSGIEYLDYYSITNSWIHNYNNNKHSFKLNETLKVGGSANFFVIFKSLNIGNFTNTITYGFNNETFGNSTNSTEVINKTMPPHENFTDQNNSSETNETNQTIYPDIPNVDNEIISNYSKESDKKVLYTKNISKNGTGNPLFILLLSLLVLPLRRKLI